MKNDFDSWLDLDSASNQYLNNFNDVQTPMGHDFQWQGVLKPESKQEFDESAEILSSVSSAKRKYDQTFTSKTKIEGSQSSSSPFQDDQISSISSQNIALIKSQRQTIIKSQKQQIKRIQEQNRFLKQKIDDMSFRLRQTQIQLNKLKYSGNNNIANFQSMKEAYLKEISDLMANQKGHAEETCQVFKKLRDMTDFDGKLKVDLLNYFMSELLQNIINDPTFYYIDSILGKKGLWQQDSSITQKLRKIDQEFVEITQLKDSKHLSQFKQDLKESLSIPAQKYKNLWKTFYRSYINLLNQGFVLQSFSRLAWNKILKYVEKQNIGKLQLHFQKIKLRRDIRMLRQSWFQQIQHDEENQTQNKDKSIGKKVKLSSY